MRNETNHLELYSKLIEVMSQYTDDQSSIDVLCSVLIVQMYKSDISSVDLDAKIRAIIKSVKILQDTQQNTNDNSLNSASIFNK